MRKVYSVETKQLVCSLFREFKSYREIEALTGIPRDVLRLWKARARHDESWVLEVERKSLLSYGKSRPGWGITPQPQVTPVSARA